MFVKNDERSTTLRIIGTAACIIHIVAVRRWSGKAGTPWNSAAKAAHGVLMEDLIHISHGRSHRRDLKYCFWGQTWCFENRFVKSLRKQKWFARISMSRNYGRCRCLLS